MQNNELDSIRKVIAGVLRHARSGDLPLFTETLGLSQHSWQLMFASFFAQSYSLLPIPPSINAAMAEDIPQTFLDLVALLFEHRTNTLDVQDADWLSRAIAAACFGSRHLWQDLGLAGREEISTLLTTHFPTLQAKNIHDLKWKRFLFAALAARQQCPDIAQPNCGRCEEFATCFPAPA